MSKSSRRNFLVRTASLASVARLGFARDPLRNNNLGFQIYTLRKVVEQDPLTILKAVQDIGYREIECTAGSLDQIWPALAQTKLKPVSLHTEKSMFTPDGGLFTQAALQQAKDRGFQYLVIPYAELAANGADGVKHFAETMNRQGEQAKNNGLTLCYHNHASDFTPINGVPALHTLLEETDPKYVSLEMDIFWVSVAGHDPVAMLKALKGRVPLLHLKDKAAGTPTQFSQEVPHEDFKEVGSGSINIPDVLEAADSASVKNYFVEQDQTAGDPIISLKKSYEYLKPIFKS
ncbi:MAG: sugar phosphate isomerase/epimerase [Acidobacteriaceae bacterium]|nr:sugar phosphate isomerase/epimerase [Acidobacteriaceae bacterium]